jgi:putative addiction module component (TIGR02574 family)
LGKTGENGLLDLVGSCSIHLSYGRCRSQITPCPRDGASLANLNRGARAMPFRPWPRVLFAEAHPRLILMDLKGIMALMTLRVLEKEVLELPPRARVRLAERILESIDDYADPELEAAWDDEIERRVKEIQSGAEKGIPAGEVMKEARRALNETRRLPSPRRK